MARWGAFILGLLNISVRKEQCCNNDICFTNESPFDDLPLPKCPEVIRPAFKLYSRDNPYLPELVYPDRLPDIFNGSRRTVFVVHGYMPELADLRNPNWLRRLKNKLIQRDDVNVILVEWPRGSQELLYPASAANTRAVGVRIAQVAESLVDRGNSSRDQLWCVGHSLGAHVCGHAGRRYKLGRITGLDPAGPLFEDKPISVGLDPTCADFVDVWHTHGKRGILPRLGTRRPLGHVDFYPNGGGQQPGCRVRDLFQRGKGRRRTPDLLPDCSHMRVLQFFEESLSNACHFTATMKCQDASNIPDDCERCNSTCQMMGPEAETLPGRGLYFLETNSVSPFCKGGA